MTMKPVLVIGCSEGKKSKALPAFELYNGTAFELIRANIDNVHDHFEVLILSAKHGLIPANKIIEPYNEKMPGRKTKKERAKLIEYAKAHQLPARKLLEQYADKNRDLYIVLTNDYTAAIDEMAKTTAFAKTFRKFNSVYISRKHAGIGVLRGRIKKILLAATAPEETKAVTLFRSGLASDPEMIGYSQANANLGASLAYVSDTKFPHRLKYLIQSMEAGNRAFLDNGMITEIGKGNFIEPAEVFKCYVRIIEKLKPRVAKNLSIVIPDDPFSPDAAVKIVRENKAAIKWLAKRCDVILPVHRAPSIIKHAHNLMKELNYIGNIRLGVPCKEKLKTGEGKDDFIPLMLEMTDIEALFELKNPRGTRLFSKVHFLALSEVSKGGIYQSRELLSNMYSMDMSCDACRTTAVMGNENTSNRPGSIALRQIHTEFFEKNTQRSEYFSKYDINTEYDDTMLFDAAKEAIEEDPEKFIKEWNIVMDSNWSLDGDGLDEDEIREYCLDTLFTFPADIQDVLLNGLKKMYWRLFSDKSHEPTGPEKRTETFARLFRDSEKPPALVQTELAFTI